MEKFITLTAVAAFLIFAGTYALSVRKIHGQIGDRPGKPAENIEHDHLDGFPSGRVRDTVRVCKQGRGRIKRQPHSIVVPISASARGGS